MGKSAKVRNKRKRRQNKQALRFGKKAKPRHMLKSGRTGSVHDKKTKPKVELEIQGHKDRCVVPL